MKKHEVDLLRCCVMGLVAELDIPTAGRVMGLIAELDIAAVGVIVR